MSWMAGRQTTRKEDEAYCLLGVFNINMPLLYGEGGKAFTRLQAEIIRESSDESLFAWNFRARADRRLLAASPADFLGSSRINRTSQYHRVPYSMTNQGLQLEFPVLRGICNTGASGVLVMLNCSSHRADEAPRCVLFLQQMPCGHYIRQHMEVETLQAWLSETELRSICHKPLRSFCGRKFAERKVLVGNMIKHIHIGDEHHKACNLTQADISKSRI